MKKVIAVAAALVVVAVFFGRDMLPLPVSLANLPLPSLPSFGKPDVAKEAWKTFEHYREFARLHDLESLKTVSHQISPTCADPDKTTECNGLMDSAFLFTKDFVYEDFSKVYYDDKQVVMLTAYTPVEEGSMNEPLQAALFFTRDTQGKIKVLGMKFCFGNPEEGDICVNTDPATRDADGDLWWDDVEAKFY